MLRIDGISYAAGGRLLLDDIRHVDDDAGCAALLGPNGAGKTVLLEICHGLLKPDAGRVSWFGSTVSGIRNDVAMTLQHPVFLARSVCANLDYVLGIRKAARASRPAAIRRVLEEVGLAHKADDPVSALSGGERQCLSIARALLSEPRALLLDEPTSQLDLAATGRVESIIRRLSDTGIKVVLTSHNPAQVRRLCDKVMFMDRGRMIACAPRDKFFNHISHPAVDAFIRSQSLL